MFPQFSHGSKLFFLKLFAISAIFLAFIYFLTLHEYEAAWKTIPYYGFLILEFFLIFYILARREITDLPAKLPLPKETLFWFAISLPFFIARIYLPWTFYRKFITIPAFLLLAMAFLGKDFASYFWQKFKKQLIAAVVLFVALNILTEIFLNGWQFLSETTTSIVAFLLSLQFPDTSVVVNPDFYPEGPVLSFKDFTVGIFKGCSGIESLIMFTFFFFLVAALDFKRLNKSRAIVLYLLGTIVMYLITVIRVWLILLSGYYFGVEIMKNLVHSYISMFLFIAYFVVFWKLSWKWLLKK